MDELLQKIHEAFDAFAKDAKLQEKNENKAAATRARKASLPIEKMMTESRKTSLEASKQ